MSFIGKVAKTVIVGLVASYAIKKIQNALADHHKDDEKEKLPAKS